MWNFPHSQTRHLCSPGRQQWLNTRLPPASSQATGQTGWGFLPMLALREEQEGNQKLTDAVLRPLFSKDLTLMDGSANRSKWGRKGEGKERRENYKLHALARKSPEVHSPEVLYHFPQHVSVYLLSYTGKLNFSLLMFTLESSHTIPAGNSDTPKPNVF